MASHTNSIWKRKIKQYIVAVLAANPFFTYGTQMAWISSAIPILQSNGTITDQPLTDETISWMGSMVAGIAVPSVMLFAFMAETYGRKLTLIMCAVPQALCWAIKIFTVNPGLLILARFLAGLSAGALFGIIPVYYKEISDIESRGTFNALAIFLSKLGVLVANVSGTYLHYYTNLYVLIFFPLFHLVVFTAVAPESPAFLLHAGRKQDAINVIAWFRNMEPHDGEVTQILTELQKEDEQMKDVNRLNLRAMFKDKATREGFKLIAVLQLALSWCGSYVVLVYASSVFKETGSTMSPDEQTIVLSSVMCFGCFFAANLMESWGRRMVCLLSFGLSAAGMLALGVWNTLMGMGIPVPSWIPLLATSVCLFCYTWGGTSVIVTIKMELFNYKVRTVMTSLSVVVSWFTLFLALKMFHPISAHWGRPAPFFFYAASTVILSIYVYFKLPETRGKSLGVIQKELLYGLHYEEPALDDRDKALEYLN